ncbi:CBS domain-containing protein [Thermopolyspora sp. NPDC052614]|uniref:CBS domain-containing protein n=1 Tax=Thermopolyspora sp. NPDC052614 TaxID=3155682 RepID=UPI00344AEFB2
MSVHGSPHRSTPGLGRFRAGHGPAQVKDVMGHVAIAVVADASFADIVAALRRFKVGAVAVVDGERRVLGVVSEDDLLLREIDGVRQDGVAPDGDRREEERRKMIGATAGEIMTSPAIVVTRETPVREAARLMHEHRIKQLPVINPDNGRIVGTVHQSDLLKVLDVRQDEGTPAGEVK